MNYALSADSSAAGRRRSHFLLAGLALGYFMVLLDTTIVTVALPAIRQDLGGGLNGLAWVANAYTMVFASLLLGMGALADRLGSKRVFLGGLVMFILASTISAAASSLGMLILLRALLGIGGAALLPASLTIIAHEFADPVKRARALGLWAAVAGAALAAGPVIGGVCVEIFGWRSIFVLNIPIAILSFALTRIAVKETPRRAGAGLDPAGQLTGMLAAAALTFGLMEGGAWGWASPFIISSFGAALILAILFVVIEQRGKAPMLPLLLFRSPAFSIAMVDGFIINFGLSGILFAMTLFFQVERGYSAALTGLAFLTLTIPMAFNPMLTSRIVGRFGAKIPIGGGFILASSGMLIMAVIPAHAGYAVTGIALLLIGLGTSFVIPALVAAVISSAPRDAAGIVSGALNAVRQLGATFGVAVFGAILDGSASLSHGLRIVLIASAILSIGGSVLAFRFIGSRS